MSAKISDSPLWLRLAALAVLAGLAVFSLGRGGEARRAWQPFPPPLDRPLPPGLTSFSLTAALGDGSREAADIGYIECLQYMGGANAGDGFWGQTLSLYREVQWLDPGYRHAIVEGISALGWLYRRPAEAESLARAAMASDHKEARYGVYVAALAYQKHLDRAGVLSTLLPEVERPDAPEMLLRVVGNLVLKQGDWKRSFGYWTWLRAKAQDPDTVAMADRTLKSIRRHLGLPEPPPQTSD
jgi:hypothetical protein